MLLIFVTLVKTETIQVFVQWWHHEVYHLETLGGKSCLLQFYNPFKDVNFFPLSISWLIVGLPAGLHN